MTQTQSEDAGHTKEQEAAKEKLDKKEWAEKKKLSTFMSGVINATGGIKSKTERIQVIVIAAVHHLGMEGLKWEEVRDELEVSGQLGSSSQEPV